MIDFLGKADDNEYGIDNLKSKSFTKNSRKSYYYCVSTTKKDNKVFYNIKLFSKFNVPFLGDIFTFKITGRTKGVKYYSTDQLLG